jgi:carbamoyltransferase
VRLSGLRTEISVYKLGLSAMGHDPAAALIDGQGTVVAAIEEGKLGRSRGLEGIPRAAIRFCFNRAGIDWRDVDQVAIASEPGRALMRKALFRARLAPVSPISSAYYLNKALGELGSELNNLRMLREMAGNRSNRVSRLDHHLCHVASAYFAAPFERALVVSLDNCGDGRSGFVGLGEGTRIRELLSIPFPHSLAWVFNQVTRLLGFSASAEEHKTQWLSLVGEPTFTELFVEMLRQGHQGPPHLNARFFKRDFAGKVSLGDEFYRRLGLSPQSWAQSSIPELTSTLQKNIASSLEKACELVVTEWLESLRTRNGTKYLCLAGGLFLNPLLIAAIERNTGFEKIFVQPAAGNEGTSLGAAWLAWHQTPNCARVAPMKNPYWGPAFSNHEIKQVLDNCKARYRWHDSEDRKIEETTQLLRAGKIVAWFQGGAEFGPRALGHRSLFASPWAQYVQENLNDYVKHRESFRPFALAIPDEDCGEYFNCSANGRFMTTMATAKEKTLKLFDSPASSFVSRQSLTRLHVVTFEDNPQLWKMLKRIGEKGPAPMLVNTSFNLFGEPLVITPRDAVRSYYCSGVDALVIENFLLTKS